MGLTSAMETAFSGLRATQAGLDVVSQNVANSGSAGYTRRTLSTEQIVAGGRTIGADPGQATRTLDLLVQRQLRLEQAGASYAATRASSHAALDTLFDRPGGTGALSTLVDTFTGKLQTLANDPSSYVAQSEVLSAASGLAGSLNDLAGQVLALRQSREDALATSVSTANDLVSRIAVLNGKALAVPGAAISDQRDALIDRLSTLMDVKVTAQPNGTLQVSTTGGLPLVDGVTATRLSFDARPLGTTSRYDTDPAARTVGTITATGPDGVGRDVVASGLIRSGEIAANLELRDRILPQAMAQLDELAAGLASALSDRPLAGTAVTSGTTKGFDLDLASLSAGNEISVTVVDGSGATRRLSFVKATGAAGAEAATASGRIGLDFSGGMASVASRIGAALGSAYTVSNPTGSTIRVMNVSTATVSALSAAATVLGIATGTPEIPLFTDGGAVFTGSFDGVPQRAGLAARLAVNPAVVGNRASLVAYGAGVPSGDTTRATLLLDRLTNQSRSFSGAAGIGGSDASWTGTVAGFTRAMIASQAADSNAASNLNEGQQVVLASVQGRYEESAGVNIDTELTQLIQLQTAYGANARLITAAKDMMDLLLRIGG